MTKEEEILKKEITIFEWGKENDKKLIPYEDALKAVKKAINYTHCCKSDSEQLLFSADEIVSKINEQTVLDGETFRVYFCEK